MNDLNRKRATMVWVVLSYIFMGAVTTIFLWFVRDVAESVGSFFLAWLVIGAFIVLLGALRWAARTSNANEITAIGAVVIIVVALIMAWNPFTTTDWGSFTLGIAGLVFLVFGIVVGVAATASHGRAGRKLEATRHRRYDDNGSYQPRPVPASR